MHSNSLPRHQEEAAVSREMNPRMTHDTAAGTQNRDPRGT